MVREIREGQQRMKTIVVLGIQRSGTSLIAEGLKNTGEVFMEPCTASHFENYEMMRIDDRILEEAGGTWQDPPPREMIQETYPYFKDEIWAYVNAQELNAELREFPYWGFKTCRTGWTADLWHPHLSQPHYMPVLRSPSVVAGRLIEDGMYHGDDALALVEDHNDRVMTFLREIGF